MSDAAPPPPKCDVCLRPKPPELGERFDGWTLTAIELELGLGRLCWSRASGPCVSLGWARVRALEAIIRDAIDARPR